jgi:4-amino-4-deoxy-L-arabinose transferase-like glycosyltransferase
LPISALGPDEGLYALIARDLLHGKLPYDGAFDHKPIAVYYLFAAFQAAFGETIASIRLIGIFVVSATAVLIAGIARRNFGADTASTCALVASYGMWSMANEGS